MNKYKPLVEWLFYWTKQMSRIYIDGWTGELAHGVSLTDSTIELKKLNTLALTNNGDFAILTLRKVTAGVIEYFELVKVTAINGNVLTVERGQGTQVHEFPVDSEISLDATASAFTQPVEKHCTTTSGDILIKNGTDQSVVLGADTVMTFPDLLDGQSLTLWIKPSAHVVTFPDVKWYGNEYKMVANKENVIVIARREGQLRGFFIGAER
jgi:hypothetical protein